MVLVYKAGKADERHSPLPEEGGNPAKRKGALSFQGRRTLSGERNYIL
jgi:hypothetical protein